jgi:hypothetical protein
MMAVMDTMCQRCSRVVSGGRLDRNEAILREHRSHLSARALAAGGYAEMNGPMGYGCDTGCEGTEYVVYGADGREVAREWSFGDPDPDDLAYMADYYGVPVRTA